MRPLASGRRSSDVPRSQLSNLIALSFVKDDIFMKRCQASESFASWLELFGMAWYYVEVSAITLGVKSDTCHVICLGFIHFILPSIVNRTIGRRFPHAEAVPRPTKRSLSDKPSVNLLIEIKHYPIKIWRRRFPITRLIVPISFNN